MLPKPILRDLTLDQALTYQKQVDKVLWIEYNILGVMDMPTHMGAILLVENTLIDILKAHGLYEEEV